MSIAQSLKEKVEEKAHQESKSSGVLLSERNSAAIIAGKDALINSVKNLDVDEGSDIDPVLKLNPFSDFLANNWLRQDIKVPPVLVQLGKHGASLWIDSAGDFYF